MACHKQTFTNGKYGRRLLIIFGLKSPFGGVKRGVPSSCQVSKFQGVRKNIWHTAIDNFLFGSTPGGNSLFGVLPFAIWEVWRVQNSRYG